MRARFVVLVTVVALLAAACSGGQEGAGPEAGSGTTRPAGAVPARPSVGCETAAPVAPGEEQVTMTSGDRPRWYYRRVPPGYDGTDPVPLVLDFHGYSEGATVHLQMSGLGPFGDEQGFVTVTPQGEGAVARWDTALGSADLDFVGDLLDDVESGLCIDTRRVFVTGLSNGAFMTSAIACAYADRVAAVAPVAGIRQIEGCKPARPVPVVAFHGTADGFVSFDGGLGEKVADLPNPDGSGRTIGESGQIPRSEAEGPSIPQIVAAWADRNDCAARPTRQRVASDVVRVRYRCPDAADVVLYRIEGGGHAWPGSPFSKAIESVVGRTTDSIVANAVMWDFFQGHPLRG